MAAIAFYPGKYPADGNGVIADADFENGFSVNQNGNEFTFSGSWICPHQFTPYTQTLISISSGTKNGVVLSANFSGDGTNAKVEGKFWVNEGSVSYVNSGVSEASLKALGNSESVQVLKDGGNISAPFLLGNINMDGF